jgi:hypothetical protein
MSAEWMMKNRILETPMRWFSLRKKNVKCAKWKTACDFVQNSIFDHARGHNSEHRQFHRRENPKSRLYCLHLTRSYKKTEVKLLFGTTCQFLGAESTNVRQHIDFATACSVCVCVCVCVRLRLRECVLARVCRNKHEASKMIFRPDTLALHTTLISVT